MGSPVAKTPNIDRIAKEGALFRNFFVSIPLCSPSRGSFLTGQYAHTHGVTNNADHSALSHKLVTFPRLLHDAGYETAYVGKWHMGNDDSPRPGFDRWVSFKGQGVYVDPAINVDGTSSKVSGYMTDILNGHALAFVKGEHKKPFALYLAHKAVHGPFTPAERHSSLYTDDAIKPAPSVNDSLEGKPVLTREVEAAPAKKPKPGKKSKAGKAAGGGGAGGLPRNQLRALAAVDEGVGQLLAALEASKQLDNTMVIFTSDNGYFWGEHGLGDKRWAYEESIRDPLLIRYPQLIKAGATFDQLVLNIDIAPTLLELAQVPVPRSVQGRSLLPLLKDPKMSWRTSFLTEYFQEKQYPRTPTWQAVRSDRWKYISYTELTGMDELYDLNADPFELKNLIDAPSAQAALKELKKEMEGLKR
jgi:N-acetylglucosamine-6-sulfatase